MSKLQLISFHALAMLALLFAGVSVKAADMGYDDPNSRYEAAKARCEGMSGSARQNCLNQAEDIRKSEDPGAGHKAERKEYKEDYKADKKKCDAMVEPDKSNCVQQLKMKYEMN